MYPEIKAFSSPQARKLWGRRTPCIIIPTGDVLFSTIALVETVVLRLILFILVLSYPESSSSKVDQMDLNKFSRSVGFYNIYNLTIFDNNCIYMGTSHIQTYNQSIASLKLLLPIIVSSNASLSKKVVDMNNSRHYNIFRMRNISMRNILRKYIYSEILHTKHYCASTICIFNEIIFSI